ncbi:hypothetical protein STENM223S_11551 [Streptomyces tendae]
MVVGLCRSGELPVDGQARAGGGGAVGRHRGAGAVVEPPVGERAVSRQLSFRPSAGSSSPWTRTRTAAAVHPMNLGRLA